MDLTLTPSQLSIMAPIERNCARHISIVNDIFSWEKELRASKTAHHEGGVLCSAVKVMADQTGLGIESSKRVLWALTREWELLHDEMVQSMEESGTDESIRMYMNGLEHQMSGNETWSRTTLRYNKVE
jgi:aristolochene synthase